MGYLNPHTHQLDVPSYPKVVVLCGSTRFRDHFHRANRDLTLAGHIVLAPGVFGHADGIMPTDEQKTMLDHLHLRKIDLAHEVYVVSDETGYYGESTRREIAYAEQAGKPVRYRVGSAFRRVNPDALAIPDLSTEERAAFLAALDMINEDEDET